MPRAKSCPFPGTKGGCSFWPQTETLSLHTRITVSQLQQYISIHSSQINI